MTNDEDLDRRISDGLRALRAPAPEDLAGRILAKTSAIRTARRSAWRVPAALAASLFIGTVVWFVRPGREILEAPVAVPSPASVPIRPEATAPSSTEFVPNAVRRPAAEERRAESAGGRDERRAAPVPARAPERALESAAGAAAEPASAPTSSASASPVPAASAAPAATAPREDAPASFRLRRFSDEDGARTSRVGDKAETSVGAEAPGTASDTSVPAR